MTLLMSDVLKDNIRPLYVHLVISLTEGFGLIYKRISINILQQKIKNKKSYGVWWNCTLTASLSITSG